MAVAIRANHQAYAGDEQELVAAVQRGDDSAFGVLYARYRPRIGAYVGSMISDHGRAEDIAQDVFVSALRRLRATDQTVIFKPWLYEIAKNACIDEYRRRRRSHEVPLEGAPEVAEIGRLPSTAPTPHAAIETKMRLDDLRGAFHGLSDSHHQILVLRELEGLSYNQIGDRMGISKPIVESTLFRARRRLGEEFAELESGRRCARVQDLIECVADGRRSGSSLGLRERRLMSRHLSHCAPCQRQARLAGVDDLDFPKKTRKIGAAALLPIPWLRWRRSGDGGLSSAHATALQAVQSLAPAAGAGNPFSGLGRAAAAAVLAIAGAGGGLVATNSIGGKTRPAAGHVILTHSFTPSTGVLGATGVASSAVNRVVRASLNGAGGAAGPASGVLTARGRIALVERLVTLLPLAIVSQGSTGGLLLTPLGQSPAMLAGSPPSPAGRLQHPSGGGLVNGLTAPLTAPIHAAGAPVATATPVLNLGGGHSTRPTGSPFGGTVTKPVAAAGAALPLLGKHEADALGSTASALVNGIAGATTAATRTVTKITSGGSGGSGSGGSGSGSTGSTSGGSTSGGSTSGGSTGSTSSSGGSSSTSSLSPVQSVIGATAGTIVSGTSSTLSGVVGGASSTTSSVIGNTTSTASGATSAATDAASTTTGTLTSATSGLTQGH